MSSSIISVENLSKKFIISHETNARYTALRDVISTKAKNLLSGKVNQAAGNKEEFWALRDINFEISQGDRVGIIGRNGAGKSTLLKVLSRITEPTKGRVRIKGRVASLLEVGTGFHPELTGRENIFLNGAILGMSRAEIRSKFDEIVAFAEIERFLDTPVKRYSSGMYVRLAFAVAAHLEPEIMIVDEVLAVGDAQFQKKCLGKMEDVSKNQGRTILFVSHQLPMIINLCSRCILMEKGSISSIGTPSEIISSYLLTSAIVSDTSFKEDSFAYSKGMPYYNLLGFRYYNNKQDVTSGVVEAISDLKLTIEIQVNLHVIDSRLNFGFVLKDEMGNVIILSMSTDMPESSWIKYKLGNNKILATLDTSALNEGRYYLYMISSIHAIKMIHTVEDDVCVGFEIMGNRGQSPYWIGKKNALLAPFIQWEGVPV